MEKLTYRQAYDKIIEAYFKDEIEPLYSEFCFCGTLNDGNRSWNSAYKVNLRYSYIEFKKMELPLLNILIEGTLGRKWKNENGEFVQPITYEERDNLRVHPNYESALFTGMCAALEVLKEIHLSRGENVDEDIPVFTKRKMANAL